MAKRLVQPLPAVSTPLHRGLLTHLELADPVTWITPISMVFCGMFAAGRGNPGFQFSDGGDLLLALLVILMCGPLGTGFSQSINDYFDRELDAINDPSRPIPAGRISLGAARLNWIILGLATLVTGLLLARQSLWLPVLGLVSLVLAAAYSVPPIKLKQNYWLGAPAVGFGYVFLSWTAGHLTFAPMTWPSLLLAFISSVMAAGLLFLNDIKSIEGDRQLGLQSMTVAFGARRTLLVAYLIVGFGELLLLALALLAGHVWAILLVLLAMVVPIFSQLQLYRNPTHNNFKIYIIASNPLVVLLQIASALIAGGYFG
jgi:bacteriochlorophyll/chlorophyll synthetase